MPIITLNHLFEDIGFQSSLFKGGFLMSQEILQTHLGDTADKPYKGTTVQYQGPPGPQYDSRRRKKRQQRG